MFSEAYYRLLCHLKDLWSERRLMRPRMQGSEFQAAGQSGSSRLFPTHCSADPSIFSLDACFLFQHPWPNDLLLLLSIQKYPPLVFKDQCHTLARDELGSCGFVSWHSLNDLGQVTPACHFHICKHLHSNEVSQHYYVLLDWNFV